MYSFDLLITEVSDFVAMLLYKSDAKISFLKISYECGDYCEEASATFVIRGADAFSFISCRRAELPFLKPRTLK